MIQIYHALRLCLSIVNPNINCPHRFNMEKKPIFRDRRLADPYIDRRSGEDRRKVYDSDYWDRRGIEKRKLKDRRQQKERRASCVNVSEWSSVCPNDQDV